jgi:RHS repeat-associated protein
MIYPSGSVLNYNYGTANGTNDVISRLDNLSETNGNVTTTLESYSYLGLGTVVKRAHPEDGVDLTYIKQGMESNGDAGDPYNGLDRFGRVVDQRWINGGGTDVDRYQYAYDRDGNITSKTNALHTAFNENYTYDGLNRLTATDRNNGTTNDQSWSLDALGNMNSVTTNGTTATRAFNDQNQLLDIDVLAPGTLAFDANGNTITDDHGDGLIYDAWNRLKQVSNGNSTLMAYGYDGKGRQVSETDANSTKTDQYFSSSWQTIEQRVGVSYGNEGTVNTQYVYSRVYLDAIVLRDRDTDANGSLDQRTYATQDAHFNVTGLVNSGGTVVQRYVYDSYGQFSVDDASWSGTTEGYAWNRNHQGLEYNAATGWYMNRNRTYSGTMMRFGQQDPMGYIDGLNDFQALRDNPIGRLDPLGLASHTLSDTAKENLMKSIETELLKRGRSALISDAFYGNTFPLVDRAEFRAGQSLFGSAVLDWGNEIGTWLIKKPYEIVKLLLGDEFSVEDWSKDQVKDGAKGEVIQQIKQLICNEVVLHSEADGIEMNLIYKPSDMSFKGTVTGKVGQVRKADNNNPAGGLGFILTDSNPEPFVLLISSQAARDPNTIVKSLKVGLVKVPAK